MGIGVVIVLHAMLFAVLLGIFFALAALLRRLLRVENSKAVLAFKIVPIGLVGMPFGLFWASIAWSNLAPPSTQFRRVFDLSANGNVYDLMGMADATNEVRHVYLSFRTSPETLHRLTEDFRSLESAEVGDKLPLYRHSAPAWWTASVCRDRTVFSGESIRQWDNIVVVACHSDGRTYVEALWSA